MLGSSRSGARRQHAGDGEGEARRLGPGGAQRSTGGGDGSLGVKRPGTNYRIVYSSDNSLSDGELHVERRAGSISAWYQHGAGTAAAPAAPLAVQRRLPKQRSSEASQDDSGSEEVTQLHSSVTMVLHDNVEDAVQKSNSSSVSQAEAKRSGDPAGAPSGGANGSMAVSRQELEDMINWETNNLFDYLKGLYQTGEGQQGQAADSEEWARRISALRQLLRERDGEVRELQRLLEARQAQLEGQEAELELQARRIEALEERIRQVLHQMDALKAACGSGGLGAGMESYGSGGGELAPGHGGLHRWQMAAAYMPAEYQQQHVVASDSCLVQLPVQSYAAHQGCGFWQSVVESVQRHPRRCAIGVAVLVLLLVIVLCAMLIPAAQRHRARPQFVVAPRVVATGGSWLDILVQLDRPSLVSYMAFRQADLNTQVPGMGRTLLELIQGEDVEAKAVYAASSAADSLGVASSSSSAAQQLSGLQQLAVACGWGPAANASGRSVVSALSSAGGASAACLPTSLGTADRCARCPLLEDVTGYTLLLVAASASGRELSSVEVVNAVTGEAAVNVNALEPPYADNATATSFDLHFKLNAAGTLFYAVAYDRLFASYGARQLVFAALTPSSSAVITANPAAFLGGLVANGSVAVPAGGQWVSERVQPPCVAALCLQSMHGLQGGTDYRVFLVAVDSYGTVDLVPAATSVTTARATSAPALLPPTAPVNITDSGFGMTVSMDAAGGVYFMLLAAKPGASVTAAADEVASGTWDWLDSLVPGNSSRRLLMAGAGADESLENMTALTSRRQLADAPGLPGALVAPTCYPNNQTCSLEPVAAFSGVPGLAASFNTLASGCLAVPEAGKALALPPFSSLQNDTLYYVLLSTEDSAVPQPNRLQPPAVFVVHTVDLSAPRLACGFPVATNITSSSFVLAAMLTKPGASVFFVVLPAAEAITPPTAQEVLRGTGASGVAALAAGNLTHWGWLPWEAAPAAGVAADVRKLWVPVAGLQSGANYTVFLTVTQDGSTSLLGSTAAALRGILIPNVMPPTFTGLKGLNASVDEQRGTFSVQLASDLDRAGQVYYALYRNYTCIRGEPSVADIVAGSPLPPSICKCDDASYCALVTAGSYAVPAQTLGAVHSVGGDLSPLPFQSLRNATDAQLKCFQGGLGQATDTYNIYLVAGNALPTYTGLAPQCSNFAQAVATVAAAAAAPPIADLGASCPAAPQLDCAQAQLHPDSQILQGGAIQAWPLNASSSSPLEWLQPMDASVVGRPARVQLSLEGGAAPAFVGGPDFLSTVRTGGSFGMQFALDKPALLIYAVFRPMPIDASGSPQAPVLIATGRVPVFDAGSNATTGAITACPWAPGGAMQAQSQFYVTYVARDKYGRMDGLCPGQQPGTAPRVCTDLAFTGG